MCTICCLLYFCRNIFHYVCECSPVSQEHKLFHDVSNKKICQNTVLPLDICSNKGSIFHVPSSVLSNDKYMYTCITYDKSKTYKI